MNNKNKKNIANCHQVKEKIKNRLFIQKNEGKKSSLKSNDC